MNKDSVLVESILTIAFGLLATYLPRLYLYKAFYKRLAVKPAGILRERFVASFFTIYVTLFLLFSNLNLINIEHGDVVLNVILLSIFLNLIVPLLLGLKYEVALGKSVPIEFIINVISYICFMLLGTLIWILF